MNTTEHLERIKARCEQLLAIAEKRESGLWIDSRENGKIIIRPLGNMSECDKVGQVWTANDAEFIASCAGPAEAGWRATIAAVVAILSSSQITEHWFAILKPMRDDIIAAWPEELL